MGSVTAAGALGPWDVLSVPQAPPPPTSTARGGSFLHAASGWLPDWPAKLAASTAPQNSLSGLSQEGSPGGAGGGAAGPQPPRPEIELQPLDPATALQQRQQQAFSPSGGMPAFPPTPGYPTSSSPSPGAYGSGSVASASATSAVLRGYGGLPPVAAQSSANGHSSQPPPYSLSHWSIPSSGFRALDAPSTHPVHPAAAPPPAIGVPAVTSPYHPSGASGAAEYYPPASVNRASTTSSSGVGAGSRTGGGLLYPPSGVSSFRSAAPPPSYPSASTSYPSVSPYPGPAPSASHPQQRLSWPTNPAGGASMSRNSSYSSYSQPQYTPGAGQYYGSGYTGGTGYDGPYGSGYGTLASTAGSTRPPSPPPATSAPWACKVCTYAHAGREALFLKCAICGALK